MRFLKVFLVAWFSFAGAFFLLSEILNVITGIDLSPYCTALMGITGLEATVSGIIEVVKTREEAKIKKSTDKLMSVDSNWCRWPDSNRHARKEQQILSLWCLPIPPQRQI